MNYLKRKETFWSQSDSYRSKSLALQVLKLALTHNTLKNKELPQWLRHKRKIKENFCISKATEKWVER